MHQTKDYRLHNCLFSTVIEEFILLEHGWTCFHLLAYLGLHNLLPVQSVGY